MTKVDAWIMVVAIPRQSSSSPAFVALKPVVLCREVVLCVELKCLYSVHTIGTLNDCIQNNFIIMHHHLLNTTINDNYTVRQKGTLFCIF